VNVSELKLDAGNPQSGLLPKGALMTRTTLRHAREGDDHRDLQAVIRLRTAFVLLLAATLLPSVAAAADLKAQVSGALKVAFPDIVAAFEKESGNKVAVVYGPGGAIVKGIEKGEVADVAVAPSDLMEKLAADGKIASGSTVGIARVSIGIAIRKGAPKPDISTVDALKKTLLAAKSIGYRDPKTGSTSGTYTAQLIAKLGLADQLKAKTKLDDSDGEHPENVFQALERGETDLQFGAITEIVMAHGVELLGPLPDEVQKVTLLTAGVPAASKQPQPAKAFVDFLASPSAASVLKANGFQPAAAR
jgi:molybdate transport system substrate-binding protein